MCASFWLEIISGVTLCLGLLRGSTSGIFMRARLCTPGGRARASHFRSHFGDVGQLAAQLYIFENPAEVKRLATRRKCRLRNGLPCSSGRHWPRQNSGLPHSTPPRPAPTNHPRRVARDHDFSCRVTSVSVTFDLLHCRRG